MRLLLSLFALSVLTLGVSVWPACSSRAVGVAPFPAAGTPRVECAIPARLRLHRFEDGSARLECGRRILVRVSVRW
ncbi:MAG TPA: hypothetical protein VMS11_09010 [Solirubrobacterales bacterium]|nr:hypothetical protein [Solirubrobacterales bacterium]